MSAKGRCHICYEQKHSVARCSNTRCKVAFCPECIRARFDPHFSPASYNPKYWICFKCQNFCSCHKCARTRSREAERVREKEGKPIRKKKRESDESRREASESEEEHQEAREDDQAKGERQTRDAGKGQKDSRRDKERKRQADKKSNSEEREKPRARKESSQDIRTKLQSASERELKPPKFKQTHSDPRRKHLQRRNRLLEEEESDSVTASKAQMAMIEVQLQRLKDIEKQVGFVRLE